MATRTELLMTAMLLLQMLQLPMGSLEGAEPGISGKRAEANVSPVHQVVAGPRPEPGMRVSVYVLHTHVCVYIVIKVTRSVSSGHRLPRRAREGASRNDIGVCQ